MKSPTFRTTGSKEHRIELPAAPETTIILPSKGTKGVAKLAARLGVAHGAGGDPLGAILILATDGNEYNIFDLVNALLDRMDGKLHEQA